MPYPRSWADPGCSHSGEPASNPSGMRSAEKPHDRSEGYGVAKPAILQIARFRSPRTTRREIDSLLDEPKNRPRRLGQLSLSDGSTSLPARTCRFRGMGSPCRLSPFCGSAKPQEKTRRPRGFIPSSARLDVVGHGSPSGGFPHRVAILAVASLVLFSLLVALPLGSGASNAVPTLAPPIPVPKPVHPPPLAPWVNPPRHSVDPARPTPGANVDPNISYTSEPAPMGIADLGVTPGGVAYSYYSPVFVGNATVHSMKTSDTGGGTRYMTFQLNTEVVLQNGSSQMSFWIQDVASIDSASRSIGYLDNVWNFSAGNGSLLSNSVSGNGSVAFFGGQGFYSDGAGSGYPGNGVLLTYPANVSNKLVASTVAGVPHVAFEYNDGYGWVTYDNVTFPFAHGWTNLGFYVTGTKYVPFRSGLFYDAEWDYAGSGSGQQNIISNIDMGLTYWNGHNFQSVRSAFNHGMNTGESLSNVLTTLAVASVSGSPYAHNANATGSTGPLYRPSDVATLRVTMPTASGTLQLNGLATAYIGGVVNLTVGPGEYWLAYYHNGSLNASLNVTLAGGQFLTVSLVPFLYSPVAFVAIGLPDTLPWSVQLASLPLIESAGTLHATLPNGTFPYTVGGVGGYWLANYSGTVTVDGSPVTVTLAWHVTTFGVRFFGENYPGGGLAWSVSVDGGPSVANVGDTVTVPIANGSYNYSISAPSSVTVSPASGTFSAFLFEPPIVVGFSIAPGTLEGHVITAGTAVSVDGVPVLIANGSFSLTLPAGIHQVAGALRGYTSYLANVTLPAGGTVTIRVELNSTGNSASKGGGGLFGLSSGSVGTILLIAGIAAAAVLVAVIAVVMRRRTPRRPVLRQ